MLAMFALTDGVVFFMPSHSQWSSSVSLQTDGDPRLVLTSCPVTFSPSTIGRWFWRWGWGAIVNNNRSQVTSHTAIFSSFSHPLPSVFSPWYSWTARSWPMLARPQRRRLPRKPRRLMLWGRPRRWLRCDGRDGIRRIQSWLVVWNIWMIFPYNYWK